MRFRWGVSEDICSRNESESEGTQCPIEVTLAFATGPGSYPKVSSRGTISIAAFSRNFLELSQESQRGRSIDSARAEDQYSVSEAVCVGEDR